MRGLAEVAMRVACPCKTYTNGSWPTCCADSLGGHAYLWRTFDLTQKLSPPLSATARTFISSILTGVSAIPLSVWANYYGELQGPDIDFNTTMQNLGYDNWYLVGGFGLLLFQLLLLLRWDRQERDWSRRVDYWRTRKSVEFQRRLLAVYCDFISRELGVPVSGRCFEVRRELTEDDVYEDRLYQLRDMFIERESFPQEGAFTFVKLTDKAFVSTRAILDRAPIFELLPDDHINLYGLREKKMVESRQKWVLAAPILRFTLLNQARDELAPRGCLVFYGATVPSVAAGAVDDAKRLARDAAEIFSGNAISADDVEVVAG